MPDTDQFNVTAAYDKLEYSEGDTMTIAISGDDVLTKLVKKLGGNLVAALQASDGATSVLRIPPAVINKLVATELSVVIASVTDDSGRVWTVDPSGLTATAVA